MHKSIRRYRLAADDLEGATGKIGDLPTGLFDNQHARRRIPWIEIEFPEPVKPSRCDIAQIKRGRTRPPYPVGAQC